MDKQRFSDIANEIFELHKAKSGDYGSERQYFPLGHASYAQMIFVKALRLVALAEKDSPTFESQEDTVKDIINYGMFYMDFLKELRDE